MLPGLPRGDLAQIRFSRNESKLALMMSSDTSPNDVYTIDLSGGNSARLTNALNPEITEADLVSSEVVRYKSFDGLEIPSILYRPKTASVTKKAPALVWIARRARRPEPHRLLRDAATSGESRLCRARCEHRGSSGYGKTFYHMDDKRHGDVDLKDIVYAKNCLASLAWVDGGRIGIIGRSYGGYMVDAALAFEPEVFVAGIDIFSHMNWVRRLASIPPWWAPLKESMYDEGGPGDPW